MKIMDCLTKEQTQHLDRLRSQQKKPPNEPEMTQKDWEELMGIHRDTYIRVHGKIKRK